MDKLERLERMQRLREAGALTDAEFELEKSKLLALPDSPVSSGDPPPETVASGRSVSRGSRIAGMAGATALTGLLVLLIWRNPAGEVGNTNAAVNEFTGSSLNVASPPARSVRNLERPAQLRAAFRAVFGNVRSPRVRRDNFTYAIRPLALEWVGDFAVLATNVEPPTSRPESMPCHGCSGAIGLYYLRPVGDRFEVAGRWPDFIPGGGWGQPGGYRVRRDLSTYPMVVSEAGFSNMGESCSWMVLAELTPNAPTLRGTIQTAHSFSGEQWGAESIELDGRIAGFVKDRSIDMRYAGTRAFTVRYIRSGTRYRPQASDHYDDLCGGGD